jgi:hypothetical protein
MAMLEETTRDNFYLNTMKASCAFKNSEQEIFDNYYALIE